MASCSLLLGRGGRAAGSGRGLLPPAQGRLHPAGGIPAPRTLDWHGLRGVYRSVSVIRVDAERSFSAHLVLLGRLVPFARAGLFLDGVLAALDDPVKHSTQNDEDQGERGHGSHGRCIECHFNVSNCGVINSVY